MEGTTRRRRERVYCFLGTLQQLHEHIHIPSQWNNGVKFTQLHKTVFKVMGLPSLFVMIGSPGLELGMKFGGDGCVCCVCVLQAYFG